MHWSCVRLLVGGFAILRLLYPNATGAFVLGHCTEISCLRVAFLIGGALNEPYRQQGRLSE